jgi:hypothetical protein
MIQVAALLGKEKALLSHLVGLLCTPMAAKRDLHGSKACWAMGRACFRFIGRKHPGGLCVARALCRDCAPSSTNFLIRWSKSHPTGS